MGERSVDNLRLYARAGYTETAAGSPPEPDTRSSTSASGEAVPLTIDYWGACGGSTGRRMDAHQSSSSRAWCVSIRMEV